MSTLRKDINKEAKEFRKNELSQLRRTKRMHSLAKRRTECIRQDVENGTAPTEEEINQFVQMSHLNEMTQIMPNNPNNQMNNNNNNQNITQMNFVNSEIFVTNQQINIVCFGANNQMNNNQMNQNNQINNNNQNIQMNQMNNNNNQNNQMKQNNQINKTYMSFDDDDDDGFVISKAPLNKQPNKQIMSPSRMANKNILTFITLMNEQINKPNELIKTLENLYNFLESKRMGQPLSIIQIQNTNFIPLLLQIFKEGDIDLTFVSGNVINSLIRSSSNLVTEFCNQGIVDIIAFNVQKNSISLRKNLITILANMAGDRELIRDLLIKENIVPFIIKIINVYQRNEKMMKEVIFLISNLCRGVEPPVDYNSIEPLIRIVFDIIETSSNGSMVSDAIWTISFLSRNIQNAKVLATDSILNLMYRKLFNAQDDEVIHSILGVFNAYIESGNKVALWLFKNNVIQEVLRVFNRVKTPKILQQCLLILSQLTFLEYEEIQIALVKQVCPLLYNSYKTNYSNFELKLEIAWIYTVLLETVKDTRLILELIQMHGFYELFMLFFDFDKVDFVCNLLDCLYRLIEFDNSTYKQFKIIEQLQEQNLDNSLYAIEINTLDDNKEIFLRLNKIKSLHKYETNNLLL